MAKKTIKMASKLAARGGSYTDYKFGKARGGLIERLRKEQGLD